RTSRPVTVRPVPRAARNYVVTTTACRVRVKRRRAEWSTGLLTSTGSASLDASDRGFESRGCRGRPVARPDSLRLGARAPRASMREGHGRWEELLDGERRHFEAPGVELRPVTVEDADVDRVRPRREIAGNREREAERPVLAWAERLARHV